MHFQGAFVNLNFNILHQKILTKSEIRNHLERKLYILLEIIQEYSPNIY